MSWEEAGRAVDELARGFAAHGLRKGDRVAILGRTTLEWMLADLALAMLGVVTVGIYPNSSARDCRYVLEHAECTGVVAEDAGQLAKVDAERLELVLSFADLDGLRAAGRDAPAELPEIEDDDLYTFIYTSGTTGPPKACMIRHRNYYDMVAMVDEIPGLVEPRDVALHFLPLAHNFGRLLHLAGPYIGITLALVPDPVRIGKALEAVRPTILPGVPRVFETFHSRTAAALHGATGVRGLLVSWALGVGRRASERRQERRPAPALLAFQERLAERLVFSKVTRRLGGRLRLAISGAAPLAPEICRFFHGLGILIIEGYGLTECTSAASVNRPDWFKFGTVGPALPGVDLEVAEDGEILMRTRTTFAGYYKDEEATRAVVDDAGWLHTGDVGSLDDDGFLTITDRKKDLIVTSGGKNVAPANLENALKASPFVSQALVVGDRRPYLAALVTVDEDEVTTAGRDARELVQQRLDEVNSDLTQFEQIKRFAILPREFSIEEGELTPTLKLRRRVIEDRYRDEIERLYTRRAPT